MMLYWYVSLFMAWIFMAYCSIQMGKLLIAGVGEVNRTLSYLPFAWVAFSLLWLKAFPQWSSILGSMIVLTLVIFLCVGYWQGEGPLRESRTIHWYQLLIATRPVMVLFANLLLFAAFRLQGMSLKEVGASQVVILSGMLSVAVALSMVWNDYWDRSHDRGKGKTLAFTNPDLYWRVSMTLALLAGGFGTLLEPGYRWFWVVPLLLFGCIYYVRTYRIPYLANAVVAVIAASPALIPLLHPLAHQKGEGVVLFVVVLLTIAGREILKDLEDVSIDPGYKETVPVHVGERRAGFIAALFLLNAALLALGLFSGKSVGPVLVLWVALMLFLGRGKKYGKVFIDLGTLLFLLHILFH